MPIARTTFEHAVVSKSAKGKVVIALFDDGDPPSSCGLLKCSAATARVLVLLLADALKQGDDV